MTTLAAGAAAAAATGQPRPLLLAGEGREGTRGWHALQCGAATASREEPWLPKPKEPGCVEPGTQGQPTLSAGACRLALLLAVGEALQHLHPAEAVCGMLRQHVGTMPATAPLQDGWRGEAGASGQVAGEGGAAGGGARHSLACTLSTSHAAPLASRRAASSQ